MDAIYEYGLLQVLVHFFVNVIPLGMKKILVRLKNNERVPHPQPLPVLEIIRGHRTLSDQISKMPGQVHIMIGNNDQASRQHILSCLLQGVVSQ